MEGERSVGPLTGGESPTRERDRLIEALARRQHGLLARRQLLELGLGDRAVEERLHRGLLHEVHRGVYIFGTRRITRRGRWIAAVLASGEGALLSHRSAARLWGLIPPAAERVEVTLPGSKRVRRTGILGHRSTIPDDERLVKDGIPVTSPCRTIFDLAAAVEMRELERAFHEAEVAEVRDRVSLPMLLERYPGRRGSRKVRALLEERQPETITRNDFEEAFLALVDRFRLLRPRMNADLSMRGRFFEIDALWEEQRVAVELDSRGVHGTHKRFESDRQRDRILVAEGYRTIRVTWRQLRDESEAIAADLRLALESPSPTHTHIAR